MSKENKDILLIALHNQTSSCCNLSTYDVDFAQSMRSSS